MAPRVAGCTTGKAGHVIAGVVAGAALLSGSRQADAYPFLVRRGYTGCAECHVDPSGGGVLTEYGRGQAEILLRTPWGDRSADWEPSAVKDFLFGAVPLPEEVMVQADSRSLIIPEPGNVRVLQMQADLRGAVRSGPLRASGSLGWVSEGAELAWFTRNANGGNLVARDFWLGFAPSRKLTFRAGRMNLPFGLRSEEHLLYPRELTGSDTNDGQQVGLAAAWTAKAVRAEFMGIAGNFQVAPDDFRERGVAAYAACSPSKHAEVGLTGLATHASLDLDARLPRTRAAGGAFGRVAPAELLVVMGEADLTVDAVGQAEAVPGLAGYVEADAEVTQGVHLRSTGEVCDPSLAASGGLNYAGWLGAQWFFAPHADIRADALYGSLFCTSAPEPRFMGLAQVHFFL